jgi:virginiamycin B lyase
MEAMPQSHTTARPTRFRLAVVAVTLVCAAIGTAVVFSQSDGESTTTRGVVATLHVPGPPNSVTAGSDALWVSLNQLAAGRSGPTLVRINLATGSVEQAKNLGGVITSSIRVGDSLWVTREPDQSDSKPGELIELDWSTGAVRSRVPFDRAIGGLAYGDGSLWINQVHPGAVIRFDPVNGRQIGQPIHVTDGAARGITFGAEAVWATAYEDGALVRIDPTSGSTTRVTVGRSPVGVQVAGGSVWVANRDGGTVSRVDPSTMDVMSQTSVGQSPTWVAALNDAVWITNQTDGTVTRLDVTTGKTVGPPTRVADTSSSTDSMEAAVDAISVANGAVWVTSLTTDTVSRIDPQEGAGS